jgi:hypothetical protein
MKDLTFTTLIAVFEEIFGRGLFWAMVVAAVAITAAYLYVLVRDRSMSMRKFLLAQLSMPFGAIAAVLFVQLITNSGFSDIGGPIDLIVLLGVASLGAVGIAVLVYTLQSLMRSMVADNALPRDASGIFIHAPDANRRMCWCAVCGLARGVGGKNGSANRASSSSSEASAASTKPMTLHDKLAIAGKCSSKGGGVSPHARARKPLIYSRKMARPKGFEPLTPRFVVWCSIQLSYGRALQVSFACEAFS